MSELPEWERLIADGCTQDGAHDPSPCPRCESLRAAILAAIEEAEKRGYQNALDDESALEGYPG